MDKESMTWKGKKVVVTGAGGFIGSHLCERLLLEGAEVTAFVRYNSRGAPGLLALLPDAARRSIRTIGGDLRDPEAVRSALRGQEVVFHLGALIAIPYSYVHPYEVADTNVIGTLNVLSAARSESISRLVHTSTSEVYGSAQTVPISESHPLQGQSPYSASKIGADALVESYYRSFALPVVTVRPFNTYGPRQSGRAVIPTIVGQALNGERISLGSLSPTRDFNFVSDTVEGFLALAGSDEALGQAVNVGTGLEITIGAIAEMIVRLVGRDVPIVSSDERKRPERSEVVRLICDASLATRLTGWRPLVGLEEGLERVIEFMREYPDWTDPLRYEV
jgi:NAD dependent epimerase/dehydratase